jgi:hypothetical protein
MLRQATNEGRIPDVWIFHISLLQFSPRKPKTKTPSGFGARRHQRKVKYSEPEGAIASLLLSWTVQKSREFQDLLFL